MSPRRSARREVTLPAYQPLTWRIEAARAEPIPGPSGTAGRIPPFRRVELVLPLAVAGALGVVVFRHGPRIVDDAYVTFRYARNLAEGAGLVYNAGERVLGTSAPLFALLLAGLNVLTRVSIPALAYVLGLVALPLTAALGYRLARRVAGPPLAAVFVCAALSPLDSLRVFASGMETPLYLAGLLASVELACRGRDVPAFGVAGMLFFLHPDAIALVPALVLAARATRGVWPWRALASGLVPAAVGALVLTVLYGSPLPQSVRAKRAAYAMPAGHALTELAQTVQEVVVPRAAHDLAHSPGTVADAAIPLAVAGALGVTLVRARRRLRDLTVLAIGLFSAAYFAAFALANPLVFEWYRPPLAAGAAFVLCAAAASLGFPGRTAWLAVLAATAAVHVATFAPYDPSGREDVYARAARLLALRPGQVVAAPEIGALGWATRARVLDTTGLVSPEALRWLDRSLGQGGAIPPGLLREAEADALVSLDRFLAPARAADPGALARWTEVARLDARAFGGPGTVGVFRRLP